MDAQLAIATRPLIAVLGEDFAVPMPDGGLTRYINLDNAATTAPSVSVAKAVSDLAQVYGSVQRGSGLKSVISTRLYEQALANLKKFVGATSADLVVLAINTTTAINRLAANYKFAPGDIVLISEAEHSSNDLPWRRYATVVPVRSTGDGQLDLADLEGSLKSYGRNVRMVALTGASNVSGRVPPLREAAALAHRYGAEVFVDCAQLIAHRRVDMRGGPGSEHFDYVAFSGHKMYAPYGGGVLIGRSWPFEQSLPDLPGGGTVDMITRDRVIWAGLPSKLVPGTPNMVGLVAMAIAAQELSALDPILTRNHERMLVEHGREVLESIDGVRLYAHKNDSHEDQLPVFPFTVRGFHHSLVAAVLGHEYGIAVRAGHLCQYEFMRRELDISPAEQSRQETLVQAHDKSSLYGMIRASCGLCNTCDDLSALGSAVRHLLKRGPQLSYEQESSSGQFAAVGQDEHLQMLIPLSLRSLLQAASE